MTIKKPADVYCNTCPYWGGETLVNEDDGKTYGTCRVELPTEMNAAARFKSGKISGVVANHGWTQHDYWCGRHPKMSLVAQKMLKPTPSSGIVAEPGTVEDKLT